MNVISVAIFFCEEEKQMYNVEIHREGRGPRRITDQNTSLVTRLKAKAFHVGGKYIYILQFFRIELFK